MKHPSVRFSEFFRLFTEPRQHKTIIIRLYGTTTARAAKLSKISKVAKAPRRPKTKVSRHSNNSLLPEFLFMFDTVLWNYLVFKAVRLAATPTPRPRDLIISTHGRTTRHDDWPLFPLSPSRIIGINRTRV